MTPPSTFQLVGGHVALDLVNTVSWRGDPERRIERIPSFEAFVEWSIRAGLVRSGTGPQLMDSVATESGAAQAAAHDIRSVRDDLHSVLSAHLDGAVLPPPALRRLQLRFVEALESASLSSLPLAWELSLNSPADLVKACALHAGWLLQSDAVDRIGRCSNRACGWMFIDRSRNHNRRWCSSADCGNRDRAARHYARNRSTSSTR